MKQNYIAGQWVAGVDVRRNINPSDIGDLVGEYAQADAAQTDAAVRAARAAAPGWARASIQARADALENIAAELLARKDELGDLLFALVNLARRLEIDPEGALRGTNAKFERRFRQIEAALAGQGRKPEQATLDEMEELWQQAKSGE